VVVHEEDLSPAPELPVNGFPDGELVVGAHVGLDGPAVLGRSFDGAEIPDARKGHVESPGDGSGREGQHVHGNPKLFQPLLVFDSEPVFLVDDDQAQVPEYHVLLEKSVGPDDDVHRSPGQSLEDPLLPGRCFEAAEPGHLDGKTLKALGERLVMLLGQDRGGNQHGHLLVVHDRTEGRSQGDLRLSVPHVAADQPVHGPPGSHVLEDVFDGPHLVRGFLEGEGGLEFPEILVRPGKGEPFPDPAGGVQLQEFRRDALGGLEGLLLGRLPALSPQFVHLGLVALDAHVLLDPLELVHGNVEAVPVLVLEEQEVALQASNGKVNQFPVDAHPVVHVDHEIIGMKVLEGMEKHPRRRFGCPATASFLEDLRFAHHGQSLPGPVETLLQGPHQNLDGGSLEGFLPEGQGAEKGVHSVASQEVGEPTGLFRVTAEKKRTDSLGLPFLEPSGQGFQEPFPGWVGLDGNLELFMAPGAQVENLGARAVGKGIHPQLLEGLDPCEQLFGVFKEPGGRDLPFVGSLPGFAVGEDLPGELFHALPDPRGIGPHDEASFFEIVEERHHLFVKDGKDGLVGSQLVTFLELLEPDVAGGRGQPFRLDVVVDGLLGPLLGFGVENDFACGQEQGLLEGSHGALIGRVKQANGLDFVVEEFQPQGVRVERRIHVQDSPPSTVVPVFFRQGGSVIALLVQAAAQGLEVHPISLDQVLGVLGEDLRRGQPLEEAPGRSRNQEGGGSRTEGI